MSKKYSKFITCLFCGLLAFLFAANALTPDKDFSEIENRSLAQRPKLTVKDLSIGNLLTDKGAFYTGKFMSDYETYVTDQFVARDGWVATKAWSERLSGKQENNGVYFCDDGSLITRFDQPDESRVEKNLGYVEKFAQSAGVPVTFGLIPTQAHVWAEKLPQGAPNADQAAVLSKAQQLISSAAVDTRLWETLPAHKDEAVFYRTDHHWTSLGAYYGYAALMETLGRADEIIPLSQYEKTTVSTEFYGTVFSSSGVRWVEPDEMDVFVPEDGVTVTSPSYGANWELISEEERPLYDESYLAKKDKYSMFLGGQQALGVVKTANADKPKLLLIRDSYSDSLVPFLTPHFSEIHLMDLRYFKLSPREYIARSGIDQALVLYSVPNFVTDANMAWLPR